MHFERSQYYSAIRENREALDREFPDGHLYIISVKTAMNNMRGGLITEVPTDIAAKCLVEGTHRLLTKTEFSEHLYAQTAARKRAR